MPVRSKRLATQRLLYHSHSFLWPAHTAQCLRQSCIAKSIVGIKGDGSLHFTNGLPILLLPQIDSAQNPVTGGVGITEDNNLLHRRQCLLQRLGIRILLRVPLSQVAGSQREGTTQMTGAPPDEFLQRGDRLRISSGPEVGQ